MFLLPDAASEVVEDWNPKVRTLSCRSSGRYSYINQSNKHTNKHTNSAKLNQTDLVRLRHPAGAPFECDLTAI